MIRRRTAISGSPILVGAVTALVVVISVMLAYNANKGLPFVPTYDLTAELPSGSNLVEGAEVRVGGYRTGIVSRIRPEVHADTGKAIAVVDLKLDKPLEPLPLDTAVLVRPRSALGLKYVQLRLGESEQYYTPGDRIPLRNATKPVEFDDFFSQYDQPTRDSQRTVLAGYGTALAGRGTSINSVIEGLVPFLTHLKPVMRNLSDPRTELDELFPSARRFAAEIAPVASTYAALFGNMADTFEALARDEEALRQAIERSPGTLEAGIQSFPVQRPFLADAEVLFAELEPSARELERQLPAATRAITTGEPVLRRAPPFHRRAADVLRALDELAENPNTLLALRDLRTTLAVAAPLVEKVAPYQTVCNYWNYFWTAIGEHLSEPLAGGNIQRVLLRSDLPGQNNRLGDSTAERPVDIVASEDPQAERDPSGNDLQALHRQYYSPAVDARGRADCETGQRGYIDNLLTSGRYKPTDSSAQLGGSHVVIDPKLPGRAGPTFKTGQLGIDSIKDLP
jgi:phospholipid/cholesterol/gamma-HCH transport system substrate-binding protein